MSSTRGTTSGGLEYFDAKPGEGFYARLARAKEGMDRETGATTTWTVQGPDWAGEVMIAAPHGGGAWTVTPQLTKPSQAGVAFLSRFA